MSSHSFQQEASAYLEALRRLDGNPLVQLHQRRQIRNNLLQAGWKRNSWVFIVMACLFVAAFFASYSARNERFLTMSELGEAMSILFMVVSIPSAILWLFGGLFRLCRESLGWLSQIKDSGGAQMLDGMICLSPLDDHDIILAGLRINVVPIWPRIILASFVFCMCFYLSTGFHSQEIQMQSLMFLPLSFVCLSISGILGSILLGIYLSMVGLNLRFPLVVPLVGLLFIGLEIFILSFGSAFFIEISNAERVDRDLWLLVPVGLIAGIALFAGTAWLTFRSSIRQTWLLVIAPIMLPAAISFLYLLGNLLGMRPDDEPFVTFFGNMMWIYNAFIPFSPMHAPSVMLRGVPLMEAWLAVGFEIWRWPLLLIVQLGLLIWLSRYAVIATRERRTPLQ